ncbi:replicative DNA helicase [Celeribacter sp.]|uniref:replicative DNA helicase n=1 Tax=Celeribacter sp. TaxID=1890673 RepID=UPI003A8FB001
MDDYADMDRGEPSPMDQGAPTPAPDQLPAASQKSAVISSYEGAVPHNIEAEQQLLGALLTNNEVYDKIASIITNEHFFDPVHRDIFDKAAERISKNMLASPVTLKAYMEDHEGLRELGGPSYLAKLAASAISTYAVRDYAQLIYDLFLRRQLIELGHEIAGAANSGSDTRDPTEQIIAAEARLYSLAEQGKSDTGFQSFLSAVTEAVLSANTAYERGGGMAGIATQLADLDKKMGGLHKSDLIILAGRPSMGKTSLATNIAYNVAKNYKKGTLHDGSIGAVEGGVVGFYSLEMSAEQLAARILAEASEISSHKIRQGDMTEDEFRRFVDAAKTLESCPLYIDDTPALPISQLAARARRLQRTHGLDVLIVDYLQLVRGSPSTQGNRVQEIGEISMGLKAIAKELNVPVIALSQLSRMVESREDKRPQLSDLRESGSIEQDADVVMFVFREEYYVEREKPSDDDPNFAEWQDKMNRLYGKAEVILGKQRHGPIGSVGLSFEAEFTRFGNLAQPWQERPDEY